MLRRVFLAPSLITIATIKGFFERFLRRVFWAHSRKRSKAGKFMVGRPTRTQRTQRDKSSIVIVIVIEI